MESRCVRPRLAAVWPLSTPLKVQEDLCSSLYGYWPFCRHFQMHMQFWELDQIENCVIRLAIVKSWKLSTRVLKLKLRHNSYTMTKSRFFLLLIDKW